MAEEKKYYIRVPEALVEVPKDVYIAYYQEKHRGRSAVEKEQRNGTTSYDELDTEELTGQEMIPDSDAISVEDAAIANIMVERLHFCLALLDESDKKLIHALYYEGLSERRFSEVSGIPQRTINDHRQRAIRRLKKLLENQKFFRSNPL